MVGCFLHFHEMTPTPTKKHVSCGESPVVCISYPIYIAKFSQDNIFAPRHNLKSKIPFKYLMMHIMAIQCGRPAFDMNWLIVLTAIATSALVTTITYMRDPTPALYGTPFISLCTFTKKLSKSFNNFEFTLNGVPTSLHSSILNCLRTSST